MAEKVTLKRRGNVSLIALSRSFCRRSRHQRNGVNDISGDDRGRFLCFLGPVRGMSNAKGRSSQGIALDGGCELMMMCEFAIIDTSGRFGQPEEKLGVIAGMGGTQRMKNPIGPWMAMDLR